MNPTPRQVAALSLLALVPISIYGALSGQLTPLIAVFLLTGVGLIVGSLFLLFGPAPGESDDGITH